MLEKYQHYGLYVVSTTTGKVYALGLPDEIEAIQKEKNLSDLERGKFLATYDGKECNLINLKEIEEIADDLDEVSVYTTEEFYNLWSAYRLKPIIFSVDILLANLNKLSPSTIELIKKDLEA